MKLYKLNKENWTFNFNNPLSASWANYVLAWNLNICETTIFHNKLELPYTMNINEFYQKGIVDMSITRMKMFYPWTKTC
jgi:hypothetical protein